MDQQFSFGTNKETKTSTSIEFTESYTKGKELSIQISVPNDIVTAGAKLNQTLSVSKREGETFEETKSWHVDTLINVKKGHKAVATVKVSENASFADFEVETTLSIREGKDLKVGIRKIKTGKIVFIADICDLGHVFRGVANDDLVKLVTVTDSTRNMIRHNIILKTRGTCKSVSWSTQQVEVRSEPMQEYDLPLDSDSMAGKSNPIECTSVPWKNQQVKVKSNPTELSVLPPDSDSMAGTSNPIERTSVSFKNQQGEVKSDPTEGPVLPPDSNFMAGTSNPIERTSVSFKNQPVEVKSDPTELSVLPPDSDSMAGTSNPLERTSVSFKNQQGEVKSDPTEGPVLPPDSDSMAGTSNPNDGGN